jgi:hypothetical protein
LRGSPVEDGAGLEVLASGNAVALACTYGEVAGALHCQGGDMSDNDDAGRGQEQEWIRESDLINGGLIIIGVYMVQPFLTAASLDLPARICVVAFAVAIPLLAALVLVNRRELSQHRATRSRFVVWARVVAQNSPWLVRPPGSGTSGGSPGWGCWQAGSAAACGPGGVGPARG